MADKKVVITDRRFPHVEVEKKILSSVGASVLDAQCKSEEEIMECTRDADALLVASAKITKRVIDNLEKCKVIVRYGAGIDVIDKDAATKKGIMVVNVPDFCVEEVASHTLTLILCLVRKILMSNKLSRNENWQPNLQILKPISRISGLSLGIIGIGRIGKYLAQIAAPMGFTIQAYDSYLSDSGKKSVENMGVKMVSLENLLKTSDVITIHTPLTAETKHFINWEKLCMMKSSSYLINVSRGGIIDEEALLKALQEKRIAGAGLDVLSKEPPSPNHPLFSMEQVVVTPHTAWYTEEAIATLQESAAKEIAEVLCGGLPSSLLNPEVLPLQQKE